MFTSEDTVIKMSKWLFSVFYADDSKGLVSLNCVFWHNNSVHLKDLIESLQKMVRLIGFGVTVGEMSAQEI